MNGTGEVFVSKPSRRLLKQLDREHFPKLRLNLISNGQLFNRRAFEEFDLKGRLCQVQISMDAATEATYKVVRRGGDFTRLLSNLSFLDGLRQQEGEQFSLDLLFVVSAANFRDMVEFVGLGRRLHATVRFSLVRNWYMSGAEFEKINIANSDHPQHREFLQVLSAPEFDEPHVDLGSVSAFRHASLCAS
jgi:wyosine [tRNA(Phe)-imidazoG37] synthetase (radical SAM superfamily)